MLSGVASRCLHPDDARVYSIDEAVSVDESA